MATPPTLDLDALLAPIPGENPAGEFVRYSGPYDAIQEARRADDELDKGEWKREAKAADWRAVIAIATETLATKSKDLRIAAWLVEALVKRHGFAGLRDGLRLMRELHERFWESLYPAIEDGDLEARAGALEWMNEKLPLSLRAIPVTRPRDGEAYSLIQWEESRAVENLARSNPEAHQAALAEGKLSGERLDKAVAGSPRAYYEPLFEDLTQSREECDQLGREVDKHFGRDAPSLLAVKKALEDCSALVERIVKEKRILEPDATPAQEEGQAAGEAAGLPGFAPPGSVPFAPQDRPDALRRLTAVADFFRRTEPHSPVAYLVQRAVQWGQMPLDAWLREVIGDEAVLARVRETLGLKDQSSSPSPSEGGQPS